MTAVGVTALPAIAITTSDTMLNYCIGLVLQEQFLLLLLLLWELKKKRKIVSKTININII